MSPLLFFVPPLIRVQEHEGLMLVNYLYRGLIGGFPLNAVMAYLCYSYSGHLGREGWLWVVGSLRYPYIAPFVLAFMPAKYGSAAEMEQRRSARPAAAKGAGGSFETRFPLLSAYLSSKIPAVVAHAKTRMDPIKANFEFSACVDRQGLNALIAAAEPRGLTLWMQPEEPGMRVFGAGMVAPPDIEGITRWLQQVAPLRKLATAVHPNEGPTRYFEYHPRAD